MTRREANRWSLNRQVNVSMLVQLVLLASLIVGSWVNIQQQLMLLGRDVSDLLENQKQIRLQMERLNSQSIGYEYRLRAIERTVCRDDEADERE